MPVRIPRAALVLVLGLTWGLVAVMVFSGSTREPSAAERSPSSMAVDRPGALSVLHDWDHRRAAAWAAGDASALGRLYTGRSSARAADVDLLGRYTARGLVVHGMRMQILGARVLTSRPRLLELEVTDRLASAVAVRADDASMAWRLPADTASTRVLALRRVGSRWLMARVSAGATGR